MTNVHCKHSKIADQAEDITYTTHVKLEQNFYKGEDKGKIFWYYGGQCVVFLFIINLIVLIMDKFVIHNNGYNEQSNRCHPLNSIY